MFPLGDVYIQAIQYRNNKNGMIDEFVVSLRIKTTTAIVHGTKWKINKISGKKITFFLCACVTRQEGQKNVRLNFFNIFFSSTKFY